MKKFAFYFYLVFIIGAITCIPLNFIDKEFISYVVLGQLIWGPVSIIHCFILFFTYPNNDIKKHINVSFGITIIYFLVLFTVGFIGSSLIEFNYIPEIYITIVPWLMLVYFTYIQYKILKYKPISELNLENNLIN